jgi:hypothetical protein
MFSKISLSAILFTSATVSIACSGDSSGPSTGSLAQSMIGGRDSTASEDFAVQIFRDSAVGGNGVLIAPNLVLASRLSVQSVIQRGTIDDNCSEYDGNRTGLSVTFGRSVEGRSAKIPVVKILNDGSPTACGSDLAILELATPINDVRFARLRLDAGPTLGEAVRTIGWGEISVQGQTPNTRQTADGAVALEAGGNYTLPGGTSIDLEPAFTLTSAPVCNGDDGAAVVDKNGDVLGVVTGIVSQNLGDFDPVEPGKRCKDAFSYFTSVSRNVAFIERTMQSYGRMPWRTGQAAAPGGVGVACAASRDCNSNFCIQVGSTSQCSRTCEKDGDCGAGFSCTPAGTTNVCVQSIVNPEEPASCAAGGGSGSSALMVGVAVIGLLGRKRAQRASRR